MIYNFLILILFTFNFQSFDELMAKGDEFYSTRQVSQAYDYYHQASELEVKNDVPYFKMALCLEKMNRPNEAKDNYLKAIGLNAKPLYYNNLGQLHLVLGETEDAFKFYHKALELDPSYAVTMFNLGAAYYQAGEFEKACKYLNQSYEKGFEQAKGFIEEYCN